MSYYREKCEDVKAITTATKQYELADNQVFYCTKAAWEIWQEEPLIRIMRIPRKRILSVFLKESCHDFFANSSR